MKRKQLVIAVIVVASVAAVAFSLGRRFASMRSAIAGASYRAIYLQGVLHSLRSGDTNHAISRLEFRLDENIAMLVEVEMKSAVLRVSSYQIGFQIRPTLRSPDL